MAADAAPNSSLRGRRELLRHEATGVECFSAAWRHHTTRHHAHPEYQLTWTVAGVGRTLYRGGSARLPRGAVALFHPGEPHVLANLDHDDPWTVRALHL